MNDLDRIEDELESLQTDLDDATHEFDGRIDDLEMRVEALESKLAQLTSGEAELKVKSLTVAAPDGYATITMKIWSHAAGIWIDRGDRSEPQVAIYNTRDEGAVVGCWGRREKNASMKALDVAISATDKGGAIQVVRAQKLCEPVLNDGTEL